jgi:nucleoid-associated protein YgaU
VVIYLNSRYADSEVTYILNSRTGSPTAAVLRAASELPDNDPYRPVYIWREGDRLDEVAYRTLGAAADWWRIIDANRDIINPLDIRPGTTLRIPE